MANFEALIRQALQTQNSDDAAIRERIYNSSRNALHRMLEKSSNQTPENIQSHINGLEASITKIESEYAPPPKPASIVEPAPVAQPVPAPAPVKPAPIAPNVASPAQSTVQSNVQPNIQAQAQAPNPVQSAPQPAPTQRVNPLLEPERGQRPDQAQNTAQQTTQQSASILAPEVQTAQSAPAQIAPNINLEPYVEQPQEYESVEVPPPENVGKKYKRTNPFMRRIWWVLFLLAGLLVGLWLLYAVFTQFSGNNISQAERRDSVREQPVNQENSTYITLIEANDPSALITAGRGAATLVNELNVDLLRIQSIRQAGSFDSADPILLEFQQGVLQQIAGKDVTIEIRAKSGQQTDATFSIQCDFSGVSSCGRKRFQVGLQPVDLVFALKLPSESVNGNAFLAINTDITSNSDTAGTGDLIDIVYARVRIAN